MIERVDRLHRKIGDASEASDDAQRALVDAAGLVEILARLLK